jgi:hypothetical protein
MKAQTWLNSEVAYGEELIRSAIAGGRSARDKALAPEPASVALARSAQTCLPWAAMGASIGILALYSRTKRSSAPRAVAYGLLGGLFGFVANMVLSTRQITAETVRGAMRSVNTVRDVHWLQKNPIDYA